GISPRQPSGKNIIRWLLKKRTNGSVRYCQYTSERHCCWQIEEVSGFVTPEKRSPAIIAGGAVQLIIVCL
ncbi:hypothetical protein C6554_01845, partial [Escherichia coli]|uniref:hypothetical protein n=1 Tax=Escherichia coli TaxID=562 RepID=UPI0023DDC3FE